MIVINYSGAGLPSVLLGETEQDIDWDATVEIIVSSR